MHACRPFWSLSVPVRQCACMMGSQDAGKVVPVVPAISILCNPEFQYYALLIFNNLTGGSNWTVPWPPIPVNIEPIKNCTQTSGNFSAVVPEWCCWHGVSCCLSSDPCPIDTLDTTPCGSCTVGQVTALNLGYNNVGAFPLVRIRLGAMCACDSPDPRVCVTESQSSCFCRCSLLDLSATALHPNSISQSQRPLPSWHATSGPCISKTTFSRAQFPKRSRQ